MGRALEMSRRSVERIEAKDRDGWLELFAEDAVVEDPVGPSMLDSTGGGHRGKEAIAAFYDTTISTSEKVIITFDRSIECGDEVARAGDISITLPGGKVGHVACVNIYKVGADGRLVSLRSFWDASTLAFADA
ncbi:MAG TPA: nuclear transport factor 2 family protein [Acidimicrobiales bacterium]|nr:nuclear transport factor 2 family protein [Acidimicrobiales bacterium]